MQAIEPYEIVIILHPATAFKEIEKPGCGPALVEYYIEKSSGTRMRPEGPAKRAIKTTNVYYGIIIQIKTIFLSNKIGAPGVVKALYYGMLFVSQKCPRIVFEFE